MEVHPILLGADVILLEGIRLAEVPEGVCFMYATPLNLSGAEKLSRYFGKILQEECGVESRRGDQALEARWEAAGERYRAEIARQQELYGLTTE